MSSQPAKRPYSLTHSLTPASLACKKNTVSRANVLGNTFTQYNTAKRDPPAGGTRPEDPYAAAILSTLQSTTSPNALWP